MPICDIDRYSAYIGPMTASWCRRYSGLQKRVSFLHQQHC